MELKEIIKDLKSTKEALYTQGKKSGLDAYNMGYLAAIEKTIEMLKSANNN